MELAITFILIIALTLSWVLVDALQRIDRLKREVMRLRNSSRKEE